MTLTVFTPTYNRAYTLPKLYESLCRQTSKDFCWLIIDDGSTDNTEELVKNFIADNVIYIIYHKQENSGKHVAHNKAVEMCDTELFTCVDSDDWLTSDAVEIITEKYSEEKDNNILGMIFRKITEKGEDKASPYPESVNRIGVEDLYHIYGFSGELMLVFNTDLIKECRFPVFENEKFLTERVLYNRLNSIAPMCLFHNKIYIYEYLSDGLSDNHRSHLIKCPYGFAYDHLSESFYGKKLIYKSVHYAAYKATVSMFKLDKSKLKADFFVSKLVVIFGNLLALPCELYLKYFYFK